MSRQPPPLRRSWGWCRRCTECVPSKAGSAADLSPRHSQPPIRCGRTGDCEPHHHITPQPKVSEQATIATATAQSSVQRTTLCRFARVCAHIRCTANDRIWAALAGATRSGDRPQTARSRCHIRADSPQPQPQSKQRTFGPLQAPAAASRQTSAKTWTFGPLTDSAQSGSKTIGKTSLWERTAAKWSGSAFKPQSSRNRSSAATARR